MAEKTFAELLEEATDNSRMMDAPLRVRLRAVADEVATVSALNSPLWSIAWWRGSKPTDVGQSAPQVGDAMPDFVLPDEAGRLVRLEDLLAQGPVVVSFHRGHWCPYCKLNADGLAQIAPDLKRLGARIVAISPETHQYGAELKAYARAPFPVLADVDNGYALELNLLFWVGDEKRAAMKANGFHVETRIMATTRGCCRCPRRSWSAATACIAARYIDPDYRRRMELDAIVDAVTALDANVEQRRLSAS